MRHSSSAANCRVVFSEGCTPERLTSKLSSNHAEGLAQSLNRSYALSAFSSAPCACIL